MRTDPKLSVRGLARLIEQVGKAAYNLGYTPGLNPAQWAALRYFDEATIERRTVTGFAQFQGTTKGTASQTVAALVRKGYLRRVGDKQDRRVHRLVITDEGQGSVAHRSAAAFGAKRWNRLSRKSVGLWPSAWKKCCAS